MYIRTWQKFKDYIPQYRNAQFIKSPKPAQGDIRNNFMTPRTKFVYMTIFKYLRYTSHFAESTRGKGGIENKLVGLLNGINIL